MPTLASPIERACLSFAGLLALVDHVRPHVPAGERYLLVDGSMYSPSTRAVAGAADAWSNLSGDAWQLYEEELQSYIEDYNERGFSMGWDEGCLFLYPPDYDHLED